MSKPPSLEALAARVAKKNTTASSTESPLVSSTTTEEDHSMASTLDALSASQSQSQPLRPRLAQSLLSRGSTRSISSLTVENGSEAGGTSTTSSSMPGGGPPPLTNEPDAVGDTDMGSITPDEPPVDLPKEKVHRGYKNIPSLEAITKRLQARNVLDTSNPAVGASAAMTGIAPNVQVIALGKSSPASIDGGGGGPPSLSGVSNVPAAHDEIAAASVTGPSDTQTVVEPPPPGESTMIESEDGEIGEDAGLHPLQYTWTLFHDSRSSHFVTPTAESSFLTAGAPVAIGAGAGDPTTGAAPASSPATGYGAGLSVVGEFETVENFCRYFNWLKPPSQLEVGSNYHLFKSGIKPMWEDEANANGGKWVVTVKSNPQLLDRCWSWIAMGLVGEQIDDKDEICGAVVSVRHKIDRIQIWTRHREPVDTINAIGKKLHKLLDLQAEPGIGLEFQYHSEERPARNKYITVAPRFAGGQGGGGGSYGASPVVDGAADGSANAAAAAGTSAGGGAGGWRGAGSTGGAFGAFGKGTGAFGSSKVAS